MPQWSSRQAVVHAGMQALTLWHRLSSTPGCTLANDVLHIHPLQRLTLLSLLLIALRLR